MKKIITLAFAATLFAACSSNPTEQTTALAATELVTNLEKENNMSFYDFNFKTLDGKDFNFKSLAGKRVLVVNTASECGYTPQYKQLQELYSQYGGEKFVIVGFPANNFGGQEPGSNTEIAGFCEKNFGVTFPMMEKSSVKGEDINPLYAWLTRKKMNGVADATVKWNFHKFLIDENGTWIAEYPSSVSPLDETILDFAQGK